MLISSSDAKQFHKLYPMLLKFTAMKILDPKKQKDLVHRLGVVKSVEAAVETRDILFSDPTLIERYVSENPNKLDNQELDTVLQWRNFRAGQFIVERDLKSHTIFLSTAETSETFGVLGLTTEIDEILGYQPFPVLIKTVLLQWKDRIVHDGFLASYPISFGPGMRRSFKKQYAMSKSSGITTTFLDEIKNGSELPTKIQSKNVISINSSSKSSREGLIELKIVLNHVKPTVWRKIILDPEMTLFDLHFLIQKAMGWKNSHLHNFSVGNDTRMFGPPDLEVVGLADNSEEDSRTVTLRDLISQGYKKIIYNYDFGDGWEHTLTFGNKEVKTRIRKFPHCTDGAGACPPEDSGGPVGYMSLCKVLSNPKNEEYEEMRNWVGELFNQVNFSTDDVNKRLKFRKMKGEDW